MGEVAIAAALCGLLAGSATETYHYFDVNGEPRRIEVDCETATHVIEVGLDEKVSARDSVHQAALYAYLAGFEKIPAVILIDRDGKEGKYELEMRRVTGVLGVAYGRCHQYAIERWAATAAYRAVLDGEDDLPGTGFAPAVCDLSAIMSPTVPEVTGVVGVAATLPPSVAPAD